MTQPLQIMPATKADALELSTKLRPEDAAEILAASGLQPEEALLLALDNCPESYTLITEDNQVAAMFGVAPGGIIWLLGSNELTDRRQFFLRWSSEVVDRLLYKHKFLFNYVDERNTVHHRWLQWCGFRFTGDTITRVDPNVQFLHFALGGE